MVNKHTEMRKFIEQFLNGSTYLTFESIDFNVGARALVSNYGDFVVKRDVLGTMYKEYTFSFIAIEQFDRGTSDINENNMKVLDDFNDWIADQEKQGNYPNFDTNCGNFKWVRLQNMGNLAQVDENMQLAKYLLTCKLEYTETE